MKTILVTGGTGYIGSHCIVQLLNEGYQIVVVDNAKNSRTAVLRRVENLCGKKISFCLCDLCDKASLTKVFEKFKIDVVIHCAASKNVSESIVVPLSYYQNNIASTVNLLEVMEENNVFQLVFSSSCSVYGIPKTLPIDEGHPIGLNITNTYGRTKYFIEQMLIDISSSDKRWNIISLRYFNPIGAHPSGNIGEDNVQCYANFLPLVAKFAEGNFGTLKVFGSDYNTKDGSPVRDYIHIMDLADGHVMAVNSIIRGYSPYRAYNLGVGNGLTAIELITEYGRASGKKVEFEMADRRDGDVEALVCDASLAFICLGWKPTRGVQEMCADFYRWHCQNPTGYAQDIPFESCI